MEVAKNRQGHPVNEWETTLPLARAAEWWCATCPEDVPVYPAKWPCGLCTAETKFAECEHPAFYWRTREDAPHRCPCPHASKAVEAHIDQRVVRAQRGQPGWGPHEVRFDNAERVDAIPQGEEGEGQVGRARHARNGRPDRQLGDHQTTTTGIAKACQAFIAFPDDRDRPLHVPGAEEWATKYKWVFKNFRRSDQDSVGKHHIWWSEVASLRTPTITSPLINFDMNSERRIIVDSTGWGNALESLKKRVASIFGEAQRLLGAPERDGAYVNVLAFGFGGLDAEGYVLVNDPRKFHLLVELSRPLKKPTRSAGFQGA